MKSWQTCFVDAMCVFPFSIFIVSIFSFSFLQARITYAEETYAGVRSTTVYVNQDNTCAGETPCYGSIQEAVTGAPDGATIRVRQGNYLDSFELNKNKTLTLEGGWDEEYKSQTSNTTFITAPRATQGSLVFKMVTITPVPPPPPMAEKVPSFALMVAKDTDKIEMAWIPGSDGKTPVGEIKYNIYLSTSEGFTPGTSNLKKSVVGTSQTEVDGLSPDTLYYGKLVAIYATSTSDPSNALQTKTYKYAVMEDSSAIVAIAADLGLGKYTSADGVTYTYTGGTPPATGSTLFSEDVTGAMTLRTVDSSSSSGGTVTVQTSNASLTDVFDRASVYSSFQLFDVAAQAENLPESNNRIATSKSFVDNTGGQHIRIDWKNRLLSAEQTNYAYNEPDLIVTSRGNTSVIKLIEPNAVGESFSAVVTAEFEPELITTAEWGGYVIKSLDSAKVAAKGTLSLTALARYNFAASGSVTKNFRLFERTWTSVYTAGPVPVYQEVTLSLDVTAFASAQAEIDATAQTNLTESVEVGARYDGYTWTPYIVHGESDSLSASLDIVGGANAEIRVIPMIVVSFYKVASAYFTVEPFAKSSLTFEETTNNVDFLSAHPDRLLQLTSFDASLGLESSLAVTLSALGYSWKALSPTCVLGTGECLLTFNDIDLFSLPALELGKVTQTPNLTELSLRITNGSYNTLKKDSILYEVFPDDATITAGSCSEHGELTICSSTFESGSEEVYTVFASGYGELGEMGRQFEEVTLTANYCASPQTVMWEGQEWQRCDVPEVSYTYEKAIAFCQTSGVGGYSDWRLPTKDELKSLVVCSTGTPTPLYDIGELDEDGEQLHPWYCGDCGQPGDVIIGCSPEGGTRPSIGSPFHISGVGYVSSTMGALGPWVVGLGVNGSATHNDVNKDNWSVLCVRGL